MSRLTAKVGEGWILHKEIIQQLSFRNVTFKETRAKEATEKSFLYGAPLRAGLRQNGIVHFQQLRAVPEMYPRGTGAEAHLGCHPNASLKACSSTVGGYSNYGTAIAASFGFAQSRLINPCPDTSSRPRSIFPQSVEAVPLSKSIL